jgi:ribosomal protein S18 acetylase RimI-like enzyme
MILHITRPEAEDYFKLTEICQTTKKHWGYPNYLIDLWKDELTITPRYIRNNYMLKAENHQGEILGFGAIKKNLASGIFDIVHLWVMPDYLDTNVGNLLLSNLEIQAAHRDVIKVVSDANMVGFFKRYGYQKVGEVKSKPEGHTLPLLKKVIVRKD